MELSAEHALIGSLLHDQEKMVEVMDIVSPDCFSDHKAKKCYLKMIAFFKEGKPIDSVLLVGGDIDLISYVADVSIKGGPFPIDYAQQVKAAAKDRRIREELANILNDRRHPSESLDLIRGLYEREMEVGKKSPRIDSVMERFDGVVKHNRQRGSLGIPTGFPFLQEAHVEYSPGDIWTIGGFTSVGKTALMTQKICHLIDSNYMASILVVSTEMTEAQIVARLLANFTSIHSNRILTGKYYPGEEERLSKWHRRLSDANLAIFDDIRTISEIEIAARKAELQGGVDIMFIDYVQNLMIPGTTSQYQEQSELAKRLQKLAKDVSATVICLSQVSNQVGRGDVRQVELKGAGEWAAVSDISVMLERHPQDEFLLKYSVRKNRHGAKVERKLEFKSDFTRLEDAGEITKTIK